MTLFSRLLGATSFGSPLLRTIAPSAAAAVALQTAAAIPSVACQSERFYDLSGSLTYIAVGALSLCLPALRSRVVGRGPGVVPNWRQVVLTGAVTAWAMRLGSYLFQRVLSEGRDSRFDTIRRSPPKFLAAFLAQSAWVSLCLMPVLALNAVPATALAAVPRLLATDVLGLGLWAGGFAIEVLADRQKSEWLRAKRAKEHDEQFLTRGLFSKSRFPNYFGEITLWTGLATVSAGVLARRPVQVALGLTSLTGSGAAGVLATTALAFVSPAFSAFLLLKVSGVPLSEKKYDERYGGREDYREWKRNTPRLVPKLW